MANSKYAAAWLAGVAGALMGATAAQAQTARDPLQLEPTNPRPREERLDTARRAPDQLFQLHPFVGVRTLLTDNAYLTESNKVTDLIVNPYVGVSGSLVGPRTSTYMDLAVGYDSYSRAHQLNGVTYTGMITGVYDVVPQFLAMEVYGSEDNGRTSFADTTALDRTGGPGRLQVTNLAAGPRLTTTIGDLLDLQAVARVGWVGYRTADGSNSVGDQPEDATTRDVTIGATTGDRFERQEFRLSGIYQADDSDFRRYTGIASVFVPITSGLRVLARAGADDIKQGDTVEIQSPIWTVGLEYDMDADSYIRVEGGRRYHDNNFAAEAMIGRADRFYLTGSYTQRILPPQLALQDNFLTFVSNSQAFPSPLNSGNFQIQGPIFNQLSKDKIGTVSAVYIWLDQSVSVEATWTRRQLLESPETDETLEGRVAYSRRMRPDLRGEVSLEYGRQLNNDDFGETDSYGARVTLVYDLNPSVQFTGGYAYSNGSGANILNVGRGESGGSENILFASMVKRF